MNPTTTLRRLLHSERGFGTVETAMLAPAMLATLALAIGAGRVSSATTSLDAAAFQAARAASKARTGAAAQSQGRTTAEATLATRGLKCDPAQVSVDTSGFAVPVGDPAVVRVTVTCAVPLSDLGLPGAPGTKTLTATAASPLDSFRERG